MWALGMQLRSSVPAKRGGRGWRVQSQCNLMQDCVVGGWFGILLWT